MGKGEVGLGGLGVTWVFIALPSSTCRPIHVTLDMHSVQSQISASRSTPSKPMLLITGMIQAVPLKNCYPWTLKPVKPMKQQSNQAA